jgi:hypothetical protein
MSETAPSGWYPDPPKLRYWNGERWTDETRIAPPSPATRVAERPGPSAAPPVFLQVPQPAVVERPPPAFVQVPAPAVVEAPPEAVVQPPALAIVEAAPTAVEESAERSLPRELAVFFVLGVLALVVGGAVAALGIAFTA